MANGEISRVSTSQRCRINGLKHVWSCFLEDRWPSASATVSLAYVNIASVQLVPRMCLFTTQALSMQWLYHTNHELAHS
jgi:hypothetical protein